MKLKDVPTAAHPALIAPKQRRSRELAERVLAATMRLLRNTRFNAITMADIAREADVSVGSIYSRFPSKERLLCFLADQVMFANPDGAVVKVLEASQQAPTLREFLESYLSGAAQVFTRHRVILAPMSALARDSQDGELRAYLTKINVAVHKRLREAFLQFKDEITHPSPEQAVDFAILWMGAAMRERILFGEPVSRLRPARSQDFTNELVEAVALYLTAAREERT